MSTTTAADSVTNTALAQSRSQLATTPGKSVGKVAPGTTSGSQTALASKGLGDNFDNFLKMLTTQMKNQDPLKPMDTNEMTAQLVNFANVEQNIGTNTRLDKLIALQGAGSTSTSLGYIGKVVEATGDQVVYEGSGSLPITYSLPENAQSLEISLFDSKGNKVRTLQGDRFAGSHSVAWDGLNSSGGQAAAGAYRVGITASTQDAAGVSRPIVAATRTTGRVTGVDMTGELPMLAIGPVNVALNDVIAIQ
ncbi:flagellar basal-body rod modification protein FlgD [Azospirillaceae bacterium]